jgi:anti-sigma-K factor RskA
MNWIGLVMILLLSISNLLLWQQIRTLSATVQPQKWTIVTLTGTNLALQASGVMVISADGLYGTLVVDDLPLLNENQQYQLWLIQDGTRVSGGVFSVDTEGYASFVVSSPKPLTGYSSFDVTVEPAGGSPSPTGESVLGGEF